MHTKLKPHQDDPYWTNRGDSWIRTLPARSLDEFASGNCPPLMIIGGTSDVVLLDSGAGTKSTHPSLEAAKEAANGLAQALLDTRDQRMLDEAGLDAADWRFCNQGRFVWFQSLHSADLRIERHDTRRWVAVNGRNTIGIANEPKQAADLVRRATLVPGFPR